MAKPEFASEIKRFYLNRTSFVLWFGPRAMVAINFFTRPTSPDLRSRSIRFDDPISSLTCGYLLRATTTGTAAASSSETLDSSSSLDERLPREAVAMGSRMQEHDGASPAWVFSSISSVSIFHLSPLPSLSAPFSWVCWWFCCFPFFFPVAERSSSEGYRRIRRSVSYFPFHNSY